MKQTLYWLLACTIILGGCATPTAEYTATPALAPATATETSVPTEALTATPLPEPTATETLTPKEIWYPPLDSSFSWQLSDEVNASLDATIYDLDAFETEPSLISRLHSEGKKVFCYISVGSWEEWRPDATEFPSEVVGNDYEGWEGEKWLDIRQIDMLAPIMRARLDMCLQKGFDGIEPDNVNLHWADTGFGISYEEQLAYNLWLAEEAHARGLSIGLKNTEDQVPDLLFSFDWALTEDCFIDGWCAELSPFVAAGKPVFMAEYTDEIDYETFTKEVCPYAGELGFYAILKNRNLDEYRATCP